MLVACLLHCGIIHILLRPWGGNKLDASPLKRILLSSNCPLICSISNRFKLHACHYYFVTKLWYEWVRNMLAIDDIGEVMQQNRLRWFGHVERRDELCWLKRIETLQVDGNGVKGRPKKRWREVLREDMREKGLCREDAWDR